MAPDDNDFETIFQSLNPGLALVAGSPKSLRTLRSFGFSLKCAAMRCGGDVTLVETVSPMNWEAVALQVAEFGARGVRVFVIDRFDDPSPSGVIARMNA